MLYTIERIFIICLLAFFVMLCACDNTSECGYLENRKVKLSFAKNNKTFSDTTINDYSVFIPAIQKDLLAKSIVREFKPPFKDQLSTFSSSSLYLSLSQNSDTSVFILSIKNISDTLSFYSTRRLEMISAECGFNTRFYVDSIRFTKNNIVTIKEIDPLIDKDVLNNYLIVMKTAIVVIDTVK